MKKDNIWTVLDDPKSRMIYLLVRMRYLKLQVKNYHFNQIQVVYRGEKEELSDVYTWIFLFYCKKELGGNYYACRKCFSGEILSPSPTVGKILNADKCMLVHKQDFAFQDKWIVEVDTSQKKGNEKRKVIDGQFEFDLFA